jgi:hypothetical protein
MWLSVDPALGEYLPEAPVNDEARERNGKLPGMGGVFNTVNLHLYHYAGNNPVKYTDPDGREKRKPGLLLGMSAHLDIQHALIKEYKGSSPLYLSNPSGKDGNGWQMKKLDMVNIAMLFLRVVLVVFLIKGKISIIAAKNFIGITLIYTGVNARINYNNIVKKQNLSPVM